MTLILNLYLGIVMMYHHTKNEVSMPIASKFVAWTDRQTHTHTHTHYENITSATYTGGNNSNNNNNKNGFQSKAHLPLVDRKSNTYHLTLEWPWPWYDLGLIYDLDFRQVKLIFHEMSLTLTQWPWYSNLT